MNHVKKADIVRKQNEELLKKVNDLQQELNSMESANNEQSRQAEVLLLELNAIKDKWVNAIDDLEKKKIQYANLIYGLQEIKVVMKDMNFKIPWHKKIYFKIKKKLNRK